MACGLIQKWLDKHGNNLPTTDLLRLCTLKDNLVSKTSTVIGISGFTSKDTNKDVEWNKLYQHYLDQQCHTNVYALNWEAKNKKEIVLQGGKAIVKNLAFNSLLKGVKKGLKFGGKATGKIGKAGAVASGVMAAATIYNESTNIFMDAKQKAKIAGKMLACALAMSYPFETQSITLVGFSLGTQVIKSCLKTLHSIGALSKGQNSIIQNVVLMGGAVNFDGIGKEVKWRKIFGQTVAGQIANVYSTKDYILLGYQLTHDGKKSAGRSELPFEKEKEEVIEGRKTTIHSCDVLSFRNINITLMVNAEDEGHLVQKKQGHLNYRKDNMAKILNILSFY